MSRTDAYITIDCDQCGDAVTVELTATARGGYDDRYVDTHLDNCGWVLHDEYDFCSEECFRAWVELAKAKGK